MNNKNDNSGQISAGLRKVLNSHGHAFQYAVLRQAEKIYQDGNKNWVLDAAEFPVEVKENTTHIDFILRSRSNRTYLVAECKRADPARARWCFVKSPYTWRNSFNDEIIFDEFLCSPVSAVSQQPRAITSDKGPYHLGFELKTERSGDGHVQGNTTGINQAIAQVLRGTSGLINHMFYYSRRTYNSETKLRFIPVVFTTAELWVTEVDLGVADLTTGDLRPEDVQARKIEWLWFNHNRSINLRHNLNWETDVNDLSIELMKDFTRSIAIISTEGLDSFLKMDIEERYF